MATTVYDKVEVSLQDGKVVTLKPLAIRSLRKFQEVWKKFDENKEPDQDNSLDIFIELSGVCLHKELEDKIDVPFDSETKDMTEEYREYLEDVLDMDTIYKIIEVCAGMKLNDPNLLAAAQRAMAEDGTI